MCATATAKARVSATILYEHGRQVRQGALMGCAGRMIPAGSELFAFECRHARGDWGGTIYNAASRGKALYEYFLDVSDCWPDVKFTDLRARKIGGPHTSEQFIRNAAYRGMPDVRCGQRVKVGDAFGTIVGHNSSANFDVLFDDGGQCGGLTLNVHPSSIESIPEHA